MIDIGTLYDKKLCSPLLYCARHLAYNFLLSDRKGQLKSDRTVRVSVKSLALNCLAHVGSLDPSIWNSFLSDSGVWMILLSLLNAIHWLFVLQKKAKYQ